MAIEFWLNGNHARFDGDQSMPLLWYLRDYTELLGTKFGCGMALCGACTVHVDGNAQRSCVMPMSTVAGKRITTIEGLARGEALHAVQRAWIELDVAQCGYCQSGQIMAVSALLARNPTPSEEEILAIDNLCRCGTYVRLRKAIDRAVELLATGVNS
jgi:isoquinoline 1-oxidoreductase alpha subunit